MKTHMDIRRQVFLNEHCACGGKIVRYLLGHTAPDGDGGDQVFQTKIMDCCTGKCERVFNESEIVCWPLGSMEDFFDNWTVGKLTRPEFDTEIITLLKRVGVSWTLTKTG